MQGYQVTNAYLLCAVPENDRYSWCLINCDGGGIHTDPIYRGYCKFGCEFWLLSVQPSFQPSSQPSSSSEPSSQPSTILPKVQKVKIQHDQSSNEVLNIREVEVYDESGTDQALNKPASQSTNCCSDLYPASKAVDGNKASDNFSHTNNGSGQWWQVDLQSKISLSGVTVYNRRDCCKDRLSDATVFLLDESNNDVGTYRIGDASTSDEIEISISQFTPPSEFPAFHTIEHVVGSNLCMDVQYSNTYNGNKVQLWTCNGTDAQKFYMDSLGRIRSKLGTNKCVEAGANGGLYDDMFIWDCNDEMHQQWIFLSNGKFRNKKFEKYIGVSYCVNGANSGDILELRYPSDGCEDMQEWILPNGVRIVETNQGMYFDFKGEEWSQFFGWSIQPGEKYHLVMKQCRNGVNIWEGEVYVYYEVQSGNSYLFHGRRSPYSARGEDQWETNDYLVMPEDDCTTILPKVQKVKIQHNQSSDVSLNIREVEVYDKSGTNQALNKPASQSSEFYSTISNKLFPASNAVDERAWWQVDLQSKISLSGVTVYNRPGNLLYRLSNTIVSLLDESDNVVGTYMIGIGDASTSNQIDIDISEFTPSACVPYGSDPLVGQQLTSSDSTYTWSVSGGGGGKIYQSQYLIGTFDRIEGHIAFYTEGHLCFNSPREGMVTFINDCSLGGMYISKITEPSICSYEMEVTGVCYCNYPTDPMNSPSMSLTSKPTNKPTNKPTLLNNGQRCSENDDCKSGKWDFGGDEAKYKTCL
eukprot:scaffold52785_cov48-Cyclotella_meneghiniana.AAC.2